MISSQKPLKIYRRIVKSNNIEGITFKKANDQAIALRLNTLYTEF